MEITEEEHKTNNIDVEGSLLVDDLSPTGLTDMDEEESDQPSW